MGYMEILLKHIQSHILLLSTEGGLLDMVVSQNKGTQYGPQNTIVLILGTPKRVPAEVQVPHKTK